MRKMIVGSELLTQAAIPTGEVCDIGIRNAWDVVLWIAQQPRA